MSYAEDNQAGKRGESKVAHLLSQAGYRCTPCPNRRFAGWDIQAEREGEVLTVEVKYDRMQARTGNIAVEYANPRRGEPSGIRASSSDLWAYLLDSPPSIWLFSREVLLAFTEFAVPLKVIQAGGDGNASLKIYKTCMVTSVGERIDNVPAAHLPSLIRELLEDHLD